MLTLRFHRSFAKALALLTLLIAAEPSSAQSIDLARSFLDRGQDELAFHQVLPMALDGDARAAALLADMLYEGRYVQRDVEAAMFWYAFAAERGGTGMQSLLSTLHDFGPDEVDVTDCADDREQ